MQQGNLRILLDNPTNPPSPADAAPAKPARKVTPSPCAFSSQPECGDIAVRNIVPPHPSVCCPPPNTACCHSRRGRYRRSWAATQRPRKRARPVARPPQPCQPHSSRKMVWHQVLPRPTANYTRPSRRPPAATPHRATYLMPPCILPKLRRRQPNQASQRLRPQPPEPGYCSSPSVGGCSLRYHTFGLLSLSFKS